MIDYKNIYESIFYYEAEGFQRIESPWTVTKYISEITKPKDLVDYEIKHNNKVLVASGEQSFLYLYLKNFLPKGKFQTVTPCFRDEVFDLWHTKYFIKNELIITDEVNEDKLNETVEIAKRFFEARIGDNVEIKKYGKMLIDLEYKGIELGSYGIRECNFLDWIFATGCAEPRLSQIIENKNKNLL